MQYRRVRQLLAAAACSLAAWATGAPLDRAAFVKLGGSVLKIEVVRQQGGYSLGSGVLVAPGRVVTNCHVTRDATSIRVLKYGGRYEVESQAADAEHDLCVLAAPGLEDDVIDLGRAGSLRVGQAVTAVGYTGGIGIQNSEGDVVGLHRLDGSPVIQSTNWFSSGASGGGLFDEDLKLVGILTFRMRGGEAHYFSAPVEWIEPLLSAEARYEPVGPLPATVLPFWQRAPEAQPEFLQAASLAQARRWSDLQDMARRWSEVSNRNPQPWLALGIAAEAQQRSSEAVVSFERAVEIDPSFATGWLRLGLLYARLGMRERAQKIQAILAPLSPGFAAQLAERL